MSETVKITSQNPAGSTKMLKAMVGIGVLSALLIVVTFELTQPRVQRLKAEALEKAIFEVLPGAVSSQTFEVNAEGKLVTPNSGETSVSVVYAGYDAADQLVGYAVEASGQGYADKIRILYGYNPKQQQIIGFQVLESKETPGLGDKIEKEQRFLDNFKALDVGLNKEGSIANKVVTVKQGAKVNAWEIDGITGATISSRAIGDIIGSSTEELIPLLFDNYKLMESPEANQKQNKNNDK